MLRLFVFNHEHETRVHIMQPLNSLIAHAFSDATVVYKFIWRKQDIDSFIFFRRTVCRWSRSKEVLVCNIHYSMYMNSASQHNATQFRWSPVDLWEFDILFWTFCLLADKTTCLVCLGMTLRLLSSKGIKMALSHKMTGLISSHKTPQKLLSLKMSLCNKTFHTKSQWVYTCILSYKNCRIRICMVSLLVKRYCRPAYL